MSLNLIIIAAIGLLILLILAILVVSYIGNTRKGLESCVVKYGGTCQASCDSPITGTDCQQTADKPVCCKVVG